MEAPEALEQATVSGQADDAVRQADDAFDLVVQPPRGDAQLQVERGVLQRCSSTGAMDGES
jgi:hypothetical protein